jgi:hypothetical protein
MNKFDCTDLDFSLVEARSGEEIHGDLQWESDEQAAKKRKQYLREVMSWVTEPISFCNKHQSR